jgi:hypothetical protein
MKNFHRVLIAAAVTLSLLAACGGGGDSGSPTLYGAIAVRVGGLESGVVGGQASQADANALALNRCGSGCEWRRTSV